MLMRKIVGGLLVLLISGCTSTPIKRAGAAGQAIPTLQGSYHRVRPGETLWRIAHAYGLDVKTLASTNRLPSAGQLMAGQQLFVPLPKESPRFLWPALGSMGTSGDGVDIAAPPGSLVRASRSGRVAVAARELSGWGKTIIVDHLDGYATVYTGLDQLLVNPGVDLRQGTPIGSLGARPLHFEIREGVTTKNPLALLPRE